jgi:hypothetical protein
MRIRPNSTFATVMSDPDLVTMLVTVAYSLAVVLVLLIAQSLRRHDSSCQDAALSAAPRVRNVAADGTVVFSRARSSSVPQWRDVDDFVAQLGALLRRADVSWKRKAQNWSARLSPYIVEDATTDLFSWVQGFSTGRLEGRNGGNVNIHCAPRDVGLHVLCCQFASVVSRAFPSVESLYLDLGKSSTLQLLREHSLFDVLAWHLQRNCGLQVDDEPRPARGHAYQLDVLERALEPSDLRLFVTIDNIELLYTLDPKELYRSLCLISDISDGTGGRIAVLCVSSCAQVFALLFNWYNRSNPCHAELLQVFPGYAGAMDMNSTKVVPRVFETHPHFSLQHAFRVLEHLHQSDHGKPADGEQITTGVLSKLVFYAGRKLSLLRQDIADLQRARRAHIQAFLSNNRESSKSAVFKAVMKLLWKANRTLLRMPRRQTSSPPLPTPIAGWHEKFESVQPEALLDEVRKDQKRVLTAKQVDFLLRDLTDAGMIDLMCLRFDVYPVCFFDVYVAHEEERRVRAEE